MLSIRATGHRLASCLTLLFLSRCHAEGPFTIPWGWENDGEMLMSGEDPSRRHSFCAQQQLVSSGNLKLRDALRGVNVSVMVNLMEWGPWDGTFGACADEKKEGCVFHGAVMNELSRRAGFHYKDTFTIGDSRNAADYKAWMLWVARNYDIGIGIATETADRLADGLVWTAYLTDNSFVLASRRVNEEPDVLATLFQFLRPFSWEVWMLLVVSGFFSSFLYVLTERNVNQDDLPPGSFLEQLADAFMLACFQFTQAGGFSPRTAAGRGITFTWGLTTLFTVSAYTANLATFLISKEKPAFAISTIDEANEIGARICHRKGWAIERFLATRYPRIQRVPTESQAEMWEHLRDGKCEAEAMFLSGFRTEEVKKSYNPVCEMALTPALPFSAQSGGWYSESDNGYLCTGLVKDVFQLHMSEMVADESIKRYFEDLVEVGAAADPRDEACTEEPEEETLGDRPEMGIGNMGGIYIIHAAMTLLAALTILEICLWRKAHGQPPSGAAPGAQATLDLFVGGAAADKAPGGEGHGRSRRRSSWARCACESVRARVDEVAANSERLRARVDELATEHEQRHAELHRMLSLQLQLLANLQQHRAPSADMPPPSSAAIAVSTLPSTAISLSSSPEWPPAFAPSAHVHWLQDGRDSEGSIRSSGQQSQLAVPHRLAGRGVAASTNASAMSAVNAPPTLSIARAASSSNAPPSHDSHAYY